MHCPLRSPYQLRDEGKSIFTATLCCGTGWLVNFPSISLLQEEVLLSVDDGPVLSVGPDTVSDMSIGVSAGETSVTPSPVHSHDTQHRRPINYQFSSVY